MRRLKKRNKYIDISLPAALLGGPFWLVAQVGNWDVLDWVANLTVMQIAIGTFVGGITIAVIIWIVEIAKATRRRWRMVLQYRKCLYAFWRRIKESCPVCEVENPTIIVSLE